MSTQSTDSIERIETVGDEFYRCSMCGGTAGEPAEIIHGENCPADDCSDPHPDAGGGPS